MIAQVPEVFETLTGVKVSDLMSRVPGFDGLVPSNGAGVAGNGSANTVGAVGTRTVIDGTASSAKELEPHA
jgi:hypothetical protein